MREIKFRVWDEKEKKMTGSWIMGARGDYPEIILQCTGLKDKNGKEIYEGDIVKAHINQRWGFIDRITVIRSEHLGHCMADFPEIDDGLPLEDLVCCSPNSAEVIGNIYENPELIPKE
jgi:uncharacterized phage protein (TIGR01671 family)